MERIPCRVPSADERTPKTNNEDDAYCAIMGLLVLYNLNSMNERSKRK